MKHRTVKCKKCGEIYKVLFPKEKTTIELVCGKCGEINKIKRRR